MRFFFFYSLSINLSQTSELLFLQYKNNKPISTIPSIVSYNIATITVLFFSLFFDLQRNLKDKCQGLGFFDGGAIHTSSDHFL